MKLVFGSNNLIKFRFYQAWNKYTFNKSSMNNRPTKITPSDLINMAVCTTPGPDCFLGFCQQCGDTSPSTVLLDQFDHSDEDDSWSWFQWETVNKKVDLQDIRGTIGSLLTAIDDRWPSFLVHSYCNREQRASIENLRKQSSDQTYIVAQIDFAENYTFVRQREVQSAHWNNQQATIFTIHLKIGQLHRNIAVISDYMHHDTIFVYCAQRLLVQYVKDNFPYVKKIFYLR
jgi:hypothetical protein